MKKSFFAILGICAFVLFFSSCGNEVIDLKNISESSTDKISSKESPGIIQTKLTPSDSTSFGLEVFLVSKLDKFIVAIAKSEDSLAIGSLVDIYRTKIPIISGPMHNFPDTDVPRYLYSIRKQK